MAFLKIDWIVFQVNLLYYMPLVRFRQALIPRGNIKQNEKTDVHDFFDARAPVFPVLLFFHLTALRERAKL